MQNIIDEENLKYYTDKYFDVLGPFNIDLEKFGKIGETDMNGVSIRIGGSKFAIQKWSLANHSLHVDSIIKFDSKEIDKLFEEFAKIAEDKSIQKVTISVAGRIQGTTCIFPNLLELNSVLEQKFDSDFAKIFPNQKVSIVDDAHASLVSAMFDMFVMQKLPKANLILQIIGTGVGSASFDKKNNQITKAGIGHIPAGSLNNFDETEVSIMSNGIVPVEKVMAGPAIQRAYFRKTGNDITPTNIAILATNGDENAKAILDNVAKGATQNFIGLTKYFNFDVAETIFICHGSIWKTEGLPQMVSKMLSNYYNQKVIIYYSEAGIDNWDLNGATLLGLIDQD